jgi:hypothetical protein
MELVKIKTLQEIDEIIPMIQKLHQEKDFFSLTEFLTWISINLPLEYFQIWKTIEKGIVKGYLIVQITQFYFHSECNIVDAYMEANDGEFTREHFDFIETWAKERGCTILSCTSKRDIALSKKYGFKPLGMVLKKAI